MTLNRWFAASISCFTVFLFAACDVAIPPKIEEFSPSSGYKPASVTQIKTVEQVLAATIAVVKDDIRIEAAGSLRLFTYDNRASFDHYAPAASKSTVPRHILGGASGNEIHLILSGFQDPGSNDLLIGNLIEVIAHEYGHVLQQAISGQNSATVPLWFSEGFAGWVAANVLNSLGWQPYDISLHRFERELIHHRQHVLSLLELDDANHWNAITVKPNGAIKTYVTATVAVQNLIQAEGLDAVKNYFRTGIFASSFRTPWENFVREFDGYVARLDRQKPGEFSMTKPEWRPGDTWVYRRTIPGKVDRVQRTVVKEARYEGIPCYVVEEAGKTFLYTRQELGQLIDMAENTVITRRDRPNMILNWPLHQGKEWINSYRFEDLKNRSSGHSDRKMIAINSDAVRVPAGLFNAVKIEAFDRTNGRLVSEYWYSPKVKWFVKARWYVTSEGFKEYELLEYEYRAK